MSVFNFIVFLLIPISISISYNNDIKKNLPYEINDAIPFYIIILSIIYLLGIFIHEFIYRMKVPYPEKELNSLDHLKSLAKNDKYNKENNINNIKINNKKYELKPLSYIPEMDYDCIIIGAGVSGTTLGISLARSGRKVLLVERDWSIWDRFIGELLQPGGYRSLERLGLEQATSQSNIDSIIVEGYCVVKPPSKYNPEEKLYKLHYPDNEPKNHTEEFGFIDTTTKNNDPPRGRSLHHPLFVDQLRTQSLLEPNLICVHGVGKKLIEEKNSNFKKPVVKGIEIKLLNDDNNDNNDNNEKNKKIVEVFAPLTIIADGIFSDFRSKLFDTKPYPVSSFIGLLLKHEKNKPPLPCPNYGHVLLEKSCPTLLYQISSTETRILVGAIDNIKPDEMNKFLIEKIGPQIPNVTKDAYYKAVQEGPIKKMGTKYLKPTKPNKEGVLMTGDSHNVRHPLTGAGMTVAIKDSETLTRLLKNVDFNDLNAIANIREQFYKKRWGYSSTCDILAHALHSVFSTPNDDYFREYLQTVCMEYMSAGGFRTEGPVSLLACITPNPLILTIHYFFVAFFTAVKMLFPFPTPFAFWRLYKILLIGFRIIMPLITYENVTPLAMFPINVLSNILFPWKSHSKKYEKDGWGVY